MKVVNLQTEGFVYFIEAAGVQRIKIGFSSRRPDEPGGRFDQLRMRGSPVPLRLIGYFDGKMLDEKRLHKRFSHLRVYGEWFSYSEALRQYVLTNGRLVVPDRRNGRERTLFTAEEAARVADEAIVCRGISGPRPNPDRDRLVFALAGCGWPMSRIAKAMNCSKACVCENINRLRRPS